MDYTNHSFYHEIISLLLKAHAIKQCLYHPDSYIKIMDDVPEIAYAYGANYLKEIQPARISFKEFASLIKDTFDLLPEECDDCNQLETD